MPSLAPPITADGLASQFPLRLATGWDVAASPQVTITGVTHDSRRVRPGDLYAALAGAHVHGARFVSDAAARGAVAVLTDAAGLALVEEGGGPPLPVLVATDPRAVLGPLSAAVLRNPSGALAVVGVTGTNGKTTVTWLVHHLLLTMGVPAGLIGTIGARLGDDDLASAMTTPEAPDLQALLATMRDGGAAAVAAEVSSHALDLHRVDGTRVAVAAFTNLSRDHLDFHGDMESYFAAKLRLFTGGFTEHAVICVDDEWGRRAGAAARESGLSVVTVSGGDRPGEAADVRLERVVAVAGGRQHLELVVSPGLVAVAGTGTGQQGTPPGVHTVDLPMPGRHNAVNAAIAVALVYRLLQVRPDLVPDGRARNGRLLTAICDAVTAFAGVPGRMERIVEPAAPGATPLVVVDYAHTPDAVSAALAGLRESTPGRLIVVLGAGGGRDVGKRAPMGAVAASVADVVVVTDDNPRTEDPAAIRAAVLAGAAGAHGRTAGDVVEVADRARAIARALAGCYGPQDTVLIAGKGHETGQQYGAGEPAPFDDRSVAAAALHGWAREAGLVRGC